MPTGTVKLWNDERKFGFITPDDLTRENGDVFLHISELRRAGLDEPLPGDVFAYAIGEHQGRRIGHRSGTPRLGAASEVDSMALSRTARILPRV